MFALSLSHGVIVNLRKIEHIFVLDDLDVWLLIDDLEIVVSFFFLTVVVDDEDLIVFIIGFFFDAFEIPLKERDHIFHRDEDRNQRRVFNLSPDSVAFELIEIYPLFDISRYFSSLQSFFEGGHRILDVGEFLLVDYGCRAFDLSPVVQNLRDVADLVRFLCDPQKQIVVLASLESRPESF